MSNNRSIKLCCGGRGCPVIARKGKSQVTIIDDNGNKVPLKIEEANLIHDAIKKLCS